MKMNPTKCLKCKTTIKKNGRFLPIYKTAVFKRDVGDLLCVGLCTSCTVQPSEYKAVVDAVVEYHGEKMAGNIISYWGSDKEIDEYCAKSAEPKICCVCNQVIEDTFIITSGKIRHEICPKDIKQVKEQVGRPSKAGSTAREYNDNEPRGLKNV